MTNVAEKIEPEAAAIEAPAEPAQRIVRKIDPMMCKVQSIGQCFKVVVVRLPDGVVANDLQDPEIWGKVQSVNDIALRRHDQVYIVAFDEAWVLEGRVVEANSRSVVLEKRTRIIDMSPRMARSMEDPDYRVKWFGNGYAVERKKDGHRASPIVATEAAAERELMRMRPSFVPQ